MAIVSMFWAVPGNSMGSISLRWRASMPAKTKGVDKSEIIAASEEKPDIRATTIHIRAEIPPTGNERTNITPYVVATPFPPLNLSHKGNMCPSTTANAAAAAQSGP